MNLPDIVRWAREISLKRAEAKSQATVTRIMNAWQLSGLDSNGIIWVDQEKIHEILRTDKATARELVASIVYPHRRDVGTKTYLYGPKVLEKLSERVSQAGNATTEKYLEISLGLYHELEFSDIGKLLRRESWQAMSEARKGLKGDRIKALSITEDELTGEPLQKKSAEFSHIRSCKAYPLLGLDINNGLVVNQATHKKITEKGIVNESQLFSFCHEMGWKESWYDEYVVWLRAIGDSPIL